MIEILLLSHYQYIFFKILNAKFKFFFKYANFLLFFFTLFFDPFFYSLVAKTSKYQPLGADIVLDVFFILFPLVPFLPIFAHDKSSTFFCLLICARVLSSIAYQLKKGSNYFCHPLGVTYSPVYINMLKIATTNTLLADEIKISTLYGFHTVLNI